MSQRVAGQAIQREQDDVNQHDQSAKADAEGAVPAKSLHRVKPEEAEEDHGEQEEIAVDVLDDERESGFTLVLVALSSVVNRTCSGIQEERAVISFAVVVASRA